MTPAVVVAIVVTIVAIQAMAFLLVRVALVVNSVVACVAPRRHSPARVVRAVIELQIS